MAEEKTSCVLRLFGAPQGQLAGAVGQFAPQWKTQAQWKSRGGETLLALQDVYKRQVYRYFTLARGL